ncbi:MAG: hypothetical protein ASARMPRED_006731 [Alectoria sarmentosa]|nr:MAG: hypothetical protein ASARMPRED_006731 [Alectoria sarmentosa]
MVMTTAPGETRQPKPGNGPNDTNPLYPAILATVILGSILTTIFTAARLVTKRLISNYDLEDYFLMVAWVFSIALDFSLLAAGQAGLGRHVWNLRETQFVILDQYSWALEILYIPAVWLAKASLLFQLIRIFTPVKSGPVYWACHTLIWGNLAFYVSVFFSVIFECHPVWEVWNPSYGDHCINRNVVLVASSAVNIFSDLLNLLLPMWATWHLQMAPKRKAGIIAIFATALLAFVSSICRLIYSIRTFSNPDVSYLAAQTALWGLAEVATIILCTCFPIMPRCLALLKDHYSTYNSKFNSSPPPIDKTRHLKITKVGNAQSSMGISNSGTQEEDAAWQKSLYEHLGEDGIEDGERKDVVRDMGSLRKVDIELASWDQLNAKSRVASMV